MRLSLRALAALLLACAAGRGAAAEPPPGAGGAGGGGSVVAVDDALEAELLARHAPVVLLAPGERALPSSVAWFLARSSLDARQAPAPVAQASVLGVDLDAALRTVGRAASRLRPVQASRRGSADPRDWTTYGHVYRGDDGTLRLQYWFFYPFNDFHVLFDHEGDWEHVTVRLDASLRPVGAWYARHDTSAPGRWFRWDELEREGDHPVVLSARGSHASYASSDDVRWYDDACPTRVPAQAASAGCRVWRTWAPWTGRVVATGSREHPKAQAGFITWPGEWGTVGWFRRESGGPVGPAFQAGWCAGAAPGCS